MPWREVEQLGNVQLVWAARGARLAMHARPDRPRLQSRFPVTQQQATYDLRGSAVHGRGDGSQVSEKGTFPSNGAMTFRSSHVP